MLKRALARMTAATVGVPNSLGVAVCAGHSGEVVFAPFPWASRGSARFGPARMVTRVLAARIQRWKMEQSVFVLSRLDDRTLNEIGITRSRIPTVARVAAERPGIDPRKVEP